MKHLITGAALLLTTAAAAQNSGFGAGIVIGEPTGLSGKLWLDDRKAVDMGVAWSFNGEGALHLNSSLLFHKFDVITVSKGSMPLYFGPGARVLFSDEFRLGIYFKGGVDYLFDSAPVDVFLELAPGIDLIESTDFIFLGGIGARYWF